MAQDKRCLCATCSWVRTFQYHDREKALAGAQLSEPEIMNFSLSLSPDSAHIETLNCSFLDLTTVEIKIPFLFSLCIDSDVRNIFLLKVRDQWQYVANQGPGAYSFYSISKAVHGWNFGYSTDETDVFLTNVVSSQSPAYRDRTYECAAGMEYFQSRGGRARKASVLRLLARDPMVIFYHKQGIMPQLFKLISSTGGYISCLTLMFLSCFVRKYPESAVVQIYQARTLVLERIWSQGQRPKDDSKPKEEPVALPLPPGLFTQLGRDTE